MKQLIVLFQLCLVLLIPNLADATPTSPTMIDGNGCHVCQRVCTKFGVAKGQKHCHIFSHEALSGYRMTTLGIATNSAAMYSQSIIMVAQYISLKEDGSQLLLAPIKKNIVGKYRVVAQSCGLGSDPVSISKGAPSGVKKVFGAALPQDQNGLYTININNKNFLALGTANTRLLVIDKDDEIICGGQSVGKKLYLYCQPRFIGSQRVGKKGYCRTSFMKN